MKEKTMKLKDIEAGWDKMKPATNDDLKLISARNAKIRSKREAKSATINTRIAPGDLVKFIEIANKKAIPYQTLLGSLLHQYVTGDLVEVQEARKLFKVK